jgi:hypothetical protein
MVARKAYICRWGPLERLTAHPVHGAAEKSSQKPPISRSLQSSETTVIDADNVSRADPGRSADLGKAADELLLARKPASRQPGGIVESEGYRDRATPLRAYRVADVIGSARWSVHPNDESMLRRRLFRMVGSIAVGTFFRTFFPRGPQRGPASPARGEARQPAVSPARAR